MATHTPPGMCLLHADYHPMGQDCWEHTVDWHFAHPHLDAAEQSDLYALAVERAMLDAHIRTLNPALTLAV
jgi:hypothetical protein